MSSERRDVDLSILIPTRNRPALATVAVRSALAAIGPDDEVVVADNSDEPLELRFDDPRLRVIRAPRVLAMPDNWEAVLAAARGRWVMLFNDKCRAVPGPLRELRAAIPPGVKAATYATAMFWQDLPEADALDPERLWTTPGTLVVSKDRPRAALKDSAPALRTWFDTVTYHPELPMLYTAVVHRDVLAAGRARTGRFFIGVAPDVASGVHILMNTDRYLETTYPAVLGQLPSDPLRWSNGASQLAGGALAKKFEAEFGRSPFARRRLPNTVTCTVFETLYAFHDLLGPSLPRPSWRTLANQATREIEFNQKGKRLGAHWSLLRATQSPLPRPAAALEQARLVATLRVYRALSRVAPGLPALVARKKGIEDRSEHLEVSDLPSAIGLVESRSHEVGSSSDVQRASL